MSSLAQVAKALIARTDSAQRAAVVQQTKTDRLREALRTMRGPATATQLVTAAGLPKGTNAHVLLAVDVSYGIVQRDGMRYVLAKGGEARRKKVLAAIELLRGHGWTVKPPQRKSTQE